jgi:type IV pilus assembly protein PilM
MLSSLISGQSKKPTQFVSIDLGQRTTKAVQVGRKGEGFELQEYALVDAPVFERAPSAELIGDHLKTVAEAIGYKGKHAGLVIGVNEALVRHAEVPMIPVNDLRLMLKFNSKTYLQQDLPDYVFDAYILGPVENKAVDGVAKATPKARVLVGGTKKQALDHYQAAARHAGILLDQIVPCLVCPANAFEIAYPDLFAKEVVALVDIGFKSSSISILNNGELKLSRVVNIGGDRLTAGLAESMSVSYAEAEGIKIGLPEEVQMIMQTLITPLGRELRASIDFFEHQQDRPVGHVFVSGGSSRSAFLVESLQSELMVQTKAWSPISSMQVTLPPQKMGEVEQVASQLTVAIGGAIAAL